MNTYLLPSNHVLQLRVLLTLALLAFAPPPANAGDDTSEEKSVGTVTLLNLGAEKRSPHGESHHLVEVDPEFFLGRAAIRDMILDLPGNQPAKVKRVLATNRKALDFTWHGEFQDSLGRRSEVVLTVADDELAGIIFTPEANYRLGIGESQSYELRRITPPAVPACGGGQVPDVSTLTKRDPLAQDAAKGGGRVTVDIMLVYTQLAADLSVGGIEANLQNAVDAANTAFFNSASNVRLNLVHTQLIDYEETFDAGRDLDWVATNAEVFDLRNTHAADLVGLIVGPSLEVCGIGYVMQDPVGYSYEDSGFQITAVGCLENQTLAHEFGHNLGLEHDFDNSDSDRTKASFEWSYGYRYDNFPDGFRTIMSYDSGCFFCPQVNHFSNPDQTSTGFATGEAGLSDATRTLDEGGLGIGTGQIVAGYRFNATDDDRYEPNDTLEEAFDLSSQEQSFLVHLQGPGVQRNDDWYRIFVSPGARRVKADILFDHSLGDIDLALHDASGVRLAVSQGVVDNETINFVVPTSGVYYLRVYFANQGNTYDLIWDDLPVTPDLTVTEAEPNVIAVAPGAPFEITARVLNQGLRNAAATQVRYYRSTNPTISTSDLLLAERDVPPVAVDTAFLVPRSVTIDTEGVFWVGACVKPDVDEQQISNQCSPGTKIHVSSRTDFVVSAAAAPTDIFAGDSFRITATVTNLGGVTSGLETFSFFKSQNSTVTRNDSELNPFVIIFGNVEPGATRTFNLTVEQPGVDTFWVGACVEGGIVTTNGCSNSVQIVSRPLPNPDLIMIDGNTPSFSLPGHPLELSARVVNQGRVPSETTTVQFYRSLNSTISTFDLPWGDPQPVSRLGANGREAVDVTVDAPTQTGSYYIGACVASVPDEIQTGNQCSAGRPLVVDADDLVFDSGFEG